MWVCRLPVHIGPAGRTVFYEKLRQIRDFPMGRQVVGTTTLALPLQGRTPLVHPQDVPILRESSANSKLPSGPMWASAPTETARIPDCFVKMAAIVLPKPFLGGIHAKETHADPDFDSGAGAAVRLRQAAGRTLRRQQNPKQQLRQSFRRKRLRTNRTSQRAARRIGC